LINDKHDKSLTYLRHFLRKQSETISQVINGMTVYLVSVVVISVIHIYKFKI